MRVLLTTDTVGGVWTFTRELSQGLLAHGHDVALVSFGRSTSPDQRRWVATMQACVGSRFLFRESEAPLEWMQENEHSVSGGLSTILETLAEFNADIVHANQFCWGALDVDVKRIITAHSDVLSWAAACVPDGLEPSSWLQRYCELVQAGLDGADAVVSPTQWMQSALKRNFSLPGLQHVIANGRTFRNSTDHVERKVQATSTGRLWDAGKGLATLMAIRPPMPIVLAGEDSFDGAAAVPTHIEARGPLGEASLIRLFRESSVYIVTSLYEPFGLAPLEAALCGCAIIARDIPSLREVWGDAALFFKTSAELSDLLLLCVNRPHMLHAARQLAWQRARRMSSERMASEYINLYTRVVSQNPDIASEPEVIAHAG